MEARASPPVQAGCMRLGSGPCRTGEDARRSIAEEMSDAMNPATNSTPAETFTASRWTKGNLFFPTRIVVSSLRVSRVKSRLFGSNEESISISQVASVHIATGMIWSNIIIESSAGTDPLTSHGHRKADAQRIRDLIESYQASAHLA
jgi:hypothetical protein